MFYNTKPELQMFHFKIIANKEHFDGYDTLN